MRKLQKEQAIQEYGVKYSPALGDIDIDLDDEFPREPRNALAKKLEKLSKPRFDGTLRVVEELGSAIHDFHFSDLQDVRRRYETEMRTQYKNTLETIVDLMTDPTNSVLLKHAAVSDDPEQQRLKVAFEKAQEKMKQIGQILDAGAPFKIDVTPMKDEITLPHSILEPGTTVYMVKDDGIALPSMLSGTVTQRDLRRAFFGKADYTAAYEIDTGEPASGKSGRLDKTFLSVDDFECKKPAGAVAGGLSKVVFNSKAAAVTYLFEELDAKEDQLKVQLKQLRAARRQLKLKT